jgi:pyruvate dehydrogenase complex dehydrogenase (E1) component
MLQRAERFQNDIKNYREAIDRMIDEQGKEEANKLLNNLISEVKNMDNMYVDMVYANQLPTMGNEMREKIFTLRKKLDQKLQLT